MAEQTVSVLNVVTRYISDIDEKSTKRTEKRVGGLTKLFKAAAGAFVATEIVRGLADIGTQAIQVAADFETVVQSFEVLTGSAEEAKKLIQDINEFSISTPFEPEQIQQSVKTLLGFGRTTEVVIDDINLLGEVAAATGSDLQGLAVVFGQVAGAGKLAGQDALQFVNQGIPIYQLLAESTGKTTAELKDLQAQGKITFDVLRKAFDDAAGSGGRFSGALERQSQTLNGLRSTLSGISNELLREFGNKLLPVTKSVTSAFINLGNNILRSVKPQEDLAAGVRDLQSEFNLQISTLKGLNPESEQRASLIQQINNQFKDYLPNLITEKDTYNELAAAQEKANKAFEGRILLIALNEELQVITNSLVEVQKSLALTEREAARLSEGAFTELEEALRDSPFRALTEQQQDLQQGIIDGSSADLLNAEAKRLKEEQETIINSFESLANRLGFTLSELRAKFEANTPVVKANQITPDPKEIEKRLKDTEAILDSLVDDFFKDEQKRFEILINFKPEFTDDDVDKFIEDLKTKVAQAQNDIFLIEKNKFDERGNIAKGYYESIIQAELNLARIQKELAFAQGDTDSLKEATLEIGRLTAELARLKGEVDNDFAGGLIKAIFGDDADVEAIKSAYSDLFNQLGSLATQFSAQRKAQIDSEVQLQQQRVNQILNLQEGASQEQLNIQQNRLDESLRQQEQAAKAQKAIAAAVAAAELIAAIAKITSQSGVTAPVVVPAILAAVAGFISQVPGILALKDGTEYVTGKGTHTSDSIPARLSVGERVMSFKDNKAIQHIKNKDLTNYALVGEAASKGKLAPNVVSYMMDTSLGKKLDKLTKVMNKVDHSVRSIDIRASQNLDRDGLNQLVKLGIDRQNRQQARMR